MAQFLWLMLLLLAIAFLLRVDFIFYILYVAAGIFVWSRFITPRAVQQLFVKRTFPRRSFLGETVTVLIGLENKGRLTIPWLQFSESVPPELRLSETTQRVTALKGRSSFTFTYPIKAQRRGYYKLGPLRMVSGDLFGLTAQQRGYLAPDYLTVYPRIIQLARLGLPSRLPFGTIASHQRLFEDPARPAGVRPFRSGDTLRQMNWKATARTGSLQVRTFQPAISLEAMLLLNLNEADYQRSSRHHAAEWAIVTAASLANHLISQRQAVGLLTNGVDPLRQQASSLEFDEVSGRLEFVSLPTNSEWTPYMPPAIEAQAGRAQLMKLLEQLARLEQRPTVPFAGWVNLACAGLGWGITVLAITPRGDAATCNALHRLVRTGYNPILFAVEPDHNFSEVRERARRLGFGAFNVSSPQDFDQWRAPATAPVPVGVV